MSEKPTFPLDLDDIILSIMKDCLGHQRAIPRDQLLTECQPHQVCTDSEMRLAIQFLRSQGHMICNLEDGRGYFIAATIEEFDAAGLKYTAKARATFANKHAMDITARREFDRNPMQYKMDEIYDQKN